MVEMKTRSEHLKWCKKRAREYLERGDFRQAITSMLSDLTKHPETRQASKSPAIGMISLFTLMSMTYQSTEAFIEWFN